MVWPDTFVGETTLTTNIYALRKALGDAPSGRPYIETVPKLGYRFEAPVAESPIQEDRLMIERRRTARLVVQE
jgi:DNA-binding winged helix-turn-helix (wHTH) protein